jgi:hypothetical protein
MQIVAYLIWHFLLVFCTEMKLLDCILAWFYYSAIIRVILILSFDRLQRDMQSQESQSRDELEQVKGFLVSSSV